MTGGNSPNVLPPSGGGLPSYPKLTLDPLKKQGERILEEAKTPVKGPTPKPMGGAALEDATFFKRVYEKDLLFDPEAGLRFSLGGGAGVNVPALTLADQAKASFKTGEEQNPFRKPLVQDYKLSAGTMLDIRMNRPNWFIGIRGDVSAAVQTEGIDANKGDFAGVYDQAKAIEAKMKGMEGKINELQTLLNSNPQLQQMNTLVQQLQNTKNPAIAAKAATQLKALLNSGDLQKSLDKVNGLLGEVNSMMGDCSKAMALLGDGTRTVLGEAAARGALELYGGLRTDPIAMGKGWTATLGVEGAVIVPLPNPVQTKMPYGLPSFKYLMGKVSAQAQVTTTGLADVQSRIGALQSNISALQGAVGQTKTAVNNATGAANSSSPIQAIPQLNAAANNLRTAANQANNAGTALNNNLTGLAQDLEKVHVQASVTMTTVTPNAPVGVGIRNVGAEFKGPINSWLDAQLTTGFLNPVGWLSVQENRYALEKGKDDQYSLTQLSSRSRNGFHDFYDPAWYGTAALTANKGTWYQSAFDFRLEQSLTDSDTTRGAMKYSQNLGPIGFSTGLMSTGLFREDAPMMYMAGLSIADRVSLAAAVDDPTNPSAAQFNLSATLPADLFMAASVSPGAKNAQFPVDASLNFGGQF